MSPAREDISFRSDGAECAAWLYRPEGDGRRSCVVMAHGFGATREARLDAYAERFAAAGHHALVFDYRHFGASGGEPRQLISIRRQRSDWRSALGAAREIDRVDSQRLVAWGTSYGGGHVIDLAAREQLAGAIAHTPFTDGRATAAAIPPVTALRLTAATVRDVVAAALGVTPRLIPLVGPPGTLAAMTAPGSEAGYKAMYPPERPMRNEFLPRAAATMPFWIPRRRAGSVRCPLLVQVAREDAITPARSACRVAARAPRGEVLTYPGGHFELYLGDGFERAVADQLSFLDRVT